MLSKYTYQEIDRLAVEQARRELAEINAQRSLERSVTRKEGRPSTAWPKEYTKEERP